MRLKARRRKEFHPLPFIKIGKVIFYKQEAIEKWLEAKQEESLKKIS